MSLIRATLLSVAMIALGGDATADEPSNAVPEATREVPARVLRVPRDVSPELQQELAIPPSIPFPGPVPSTPAQWRRFAETVRDQPDRKQWEQMTVAQMPVTIEARRVGGVATFTVMPMAIPAKNRHRLIIYVHGGGYVIGEGMTAALEAAQLAYSLKMKVIAVDYGMPPDRPFPAAINDVVAVWKAVLGTRKPAEVAFAGVSAGGGLTLATVLRIKQLKLPMPAAVFVGTPWVDLTNSSDSIATNEGVDNVLSGAQAWLPAMAHAYAGNHDLHDPLISPVYGDFSGCPPTILFSGTRDLLLSDTVRAHRKMRAAGVDADLHVFEAMSHSTWGIAITSPESHDAFRELETFFDKHLSR